MDILSYLIELLQQSNAVGLTGLGTFYKKKFPGRYDKEKQSFIPPGFTIEFTTNLKDEKKLAAFVSKKRNLSEGSSEYYVSQFVEEINKRLETGHEAILDGIGRLYYTENSGLSFESAEKISYGSAFFGLPNVAEPEKKSETTPVEVAPFAVEDQPTPATQVTEINNESQPATDETKSVETVDLDEVNDDLKNTLAESDNSLSDPPATTQQSNTETIQEQAFIAVSDQKVPVEETPLAKSEDSEKEVPVVPIVEAPEFVQEQHAEHPNRFGHQPESERTKTYIPLDPPVTPVVESIVHDNVVEAPEFIKEQHAEHPNRFGHDPLLDAYEERKSPLWPKILAALFILFILAALLYYFKPEWFNGTSGQNSKNTIVRDSTAIPEDTLGTIRTTSLSKQDSTAKTDSILRANQVQGSTDTMVVKKPVAAVLQTAKPKATLPTVSNDAPKPEITTFEIIGASFETVKGAENFIKQARAKGIKARIVKIHGPRKHVSLGSFQSEKEARDQLSILEKKLDGEGFYVQQLINTTP